jgi:Trk K+ transport system NAD-binding subunit|tara:strand:- start:1151 stop:2554 length:1404 start_codon:yes stop_codon:yes gene_type:complete
VKVIIVGAHGEAKELINRVSSGWSISVIDLDQEKLRNFTTNRQIDKIQGDATSSLVLKKAGLDEATAIVTLTLSDEVNLEILKIAKQNNILRLSSIINDSSHIDKFKELDVELVEPDILLARRFEHILEPRRVVSQAFAGGRAEALEIEISSDSPVRGKKLREIGSDYYIVGALLRKGKVIIPHGDTEIETGDLVTIVLQSGAFSNVINLFSGSESRFPLEFGKDIVVVLDNEKNLKNLSESEFFIRNTKATSLKLITKEDLFDNNLESTEETLKAVLKDQEFDITYKNKISNKDLENFINENSIGTIFYPVEDSISKSKIKSLISIANKSKIPVLFSRSTYPYKTIGLLINDNFDENSSNAIAFDLSSTMSAKLVGVIINQPTFLQSDGEQKVSDTVQKLQDLALSHEVQLDFENFEGNEAKIFTDQTSSYDLSIIGSNSSQSWQDRKVIEFVSTNSNSSVLYIPR